MIKSLVMVLSICFSFVASSAYAEDDNGESYVGKKVDSPIGTVRVDKGLGGTTVRPDSTMGPSVTVKSDPPSRENPQGNTQGTVGITIETE